MKSYIYRALAATGCAAMLSACSVNYWNDHELDGFKEKLDAEGGITNKQTIDYTLTAADYKAIADNSTNKKLAEAAGNADALKALSTQCYFTDAITPNEYVPAFFESTSFPYYTLSNGSAVVLTYNVGNAGVAVAAAKPEAAELYTVSDTDYQDVWGSENDYTPAFTPAHPVSASISAILDNAFPNAEEGQWVLATYNTSDTDPVFGSAAEPVEPGFTLSNVLGSVAVDDEITVNGYVSAISTNGCILNDAGGSIFVYNPTDLSSLSIGDQIVLNGTVGAYNKGFQIAAGATFDVAGTQTVTYPEARKLTGADLDQIITRTDNEAPIYCSITGTVKVNGNNINIIVDGAEKAQASAYFTPDALKAMLADGSEVTIEGYLIAIAGGRYCSTVVTSVNGTSMVASKGVSQTTVVKVASQSVSALYSYDGSRWIAQTDYDALSASDYRAMNQRYDNLSGELPQEYLPLYVNKQYPYAQEGDTRYIVYLYYSGSTSVRCMPFVYRNGEWVYNDGVTTETAQFVMADGKWMYDPNVEITLPAGKNQELSTLYYQACVDWVKNNVLDGDKYVTSYGNNDYYTGASAYQGNVDLRASSARAQYEAAYADMTDDEVVEVMKERFAFEVLPAVLGELNPDATTIDGFDVMYTINFAIYTGTTSQHVIRYKVVGPAEFEFVDCTWWETTPEH